MQIPFKLAAICIAVVVSHPQHVHVALSYQRSNHSRVIMYCCNTVVKKPLASLALEHSISTSYLVLIHGNVLKRDGWNISTKVA